MVEDKSEHIPMEHKYSEITRRRMSEAKKRFYASGGRVWNKMSDEESRKECLKCNKHFRITSRARIRTAKFCSMECAKGHNIFSKGFTPWNKGKVHLRGSNHWNWRGGVDKEHTRIKQTEEYRNWQQAVYRKDKWMCQHCGYRGRKIVAHHIKLFSKFPLLRFEVSNGMVLCRSCHQNVHNPRKICSTKS